jgi:L-lactate utilization protein LutC
LVDFLLAGGVPRHRRTFVTLAAFADQAQPGIVLQGRAGQGRAGKAATPSCVRGVVRKERTVSDMPAASLTGLPQ